MIRTVNGRTISSYVTFNAVIVKIIDSNCDIGKNAPNAILANIAVSINAPTQVLKIARKAKLRPSSIILRVDIAEALSSV